MPISDKILNVLKQNAKQAEETIALLKEQLILLEKETSKYILWLKQACINTHMVLSLRLHILLFITSFPHVRSYLLLPVEKLMWFSFRISIIKIALFACQATRIVL